MKDPTHPVWCERSLCGVLLTDEPEWRQVLLHRGATFTYGTPTDGELVVELCQAEGEPPAVVVGPAIIPLGQAAALSGTLLRLVDLATFVTGPSATDRGVAALHQLHADDETGEWARGNHIVEPVSSADVGGQPAKLRAAELVEVQTMRRDLAELVERTAAERRRPDLDGVLLDHVLATIATIIGAKR